MERLKALYTRLCEHPKLGTLVQFIKFGIVGVSNTLVDLAVYYIIVLINPALYILGKTAGFIISVLNAFYWNNRYVFKTGGNGNNLRSTLMRLGRTYLTYGSTFLLTTLLLWLEVEKFGISELIAPLINMVITIPLNFLMNKFWAFKK